MCGIFGFTGTLPDPNLCNQLAALAETRGPHAWGISTRTPDGQIQTVKQTGSITAARPQWPQTSFIGLCRMATSGTWRDPANNQPMVSGRVALVHNGNVYNDRDIFRRHAVSPETGCDSEAILVAYLQSTALSPAARLRDAAGQVDRRSPLAVLVLEADGALVAMRRGHPLYMRPGLGGFYFCSRRWSPDCSLLIDHTPMRVGAA